MDLLDLVIQLGEPLFVSTVDVPPGFLLLLFFVGLLMGWLLSH
ncbi:MAG TPA: hypothetical protein VNP04_09910 [Alphaproteobacteria bacterium]|nr:hypothetical protein [Alphaproteobacteria bacterium]